MKHSGGAILEKWVLSIFLCLVQGRNEETEPGQAEAGVIELHGSDKQDTATYEEE